MKKPRSIALPLIVASLLSGWFGYWLALQRAVAPPIDGVPIVTMLSCPAPALAASTTAVSSTAPVPATASIEPPHHRSPVPGEKPLVNQLPELKVSEAHREELLQFIRDRSTALQGCMPVGHDRLRLTIRIDVGAQGAIQQAQIVDGDPKQRQIASCVSSRMTKWTLPPEWVQAHQSLLMSVVL